MVAGRDRGLGPLRALAAAALVAPAAALTYLPIDLLRRRRDAFELYRLDSDPAWIAHLATDRYLSRSEFELRYTRHFPGATFSRAKHLEICSWDDR